LSFIQPHPEF